MHLSREPSICGVLQLRIGIRLPRFQRLCLRERYGRWFSTLRTPMLAVKLTILAGCLAAACGGRITSTSGNDAGANDGGVGTDGWRCGNPDPVAVFPTLCNANQMSACQSWAQSLVRTGYAHSTCKMGTPGCVFGDVCLASGDCPCDGRAMLYCVQGEVCYSDTRDGMRRCVKACSR